MMKKQTAIVICMAGLITVLSACNESHVKKRKKEMVEQWEKSTAAAQLPAIEGLIERGQIAEAKKELISCIQTNPELANAYVLIGRIHFIEARNNLARQAFEQAVELDPQLDQAWHFLGSLAVIERDYPTALEHFQKALELMPAKTEYVLSLCNVYIETEQFDLATEKVDQALDKLPQNLDLLLCKAQVCQELGQTDQAVRVYEQALLMHGDKSRILEPCGYAYIALEEWGKAADKFDKVIEQIKDDEDHYHVTMRSLATCLFHSGQYGRALYWYDKLSVIYRDDADIWLNMANAALNMNNGKRASYCALNALKIRPSWSRGYALLGSARYMQGLYEQSIRAFYEISGDDELGAFAWFMTGRCYQQLGQNRQANVAFERAEELDPNNELVSMFLKKTVHPL